MPDYIPRSRNGGSSEYANMTGSSVCPQQHCPNLAPKLCLQILSYLRHHEGHTYLSDYAIQLENRRTCSE